MHIGMISRHSFQVRLCTYNHDNRRITLMGMFYHASSNRRQIMGVVATHHRHSDLLMPKICSPTDIGKALVKLWLST